MANVYAQIEVANWLVAEAQQRLDDQPARILHLEGGKHDTAEAKAMLREFKLVLARRIEHRDRLLRALVANQLTSARSDQTGPPFRRIT